MQVPPVPCGDRNQCSPALSAWPTPHGGGTFVSEQEVTHSVPNLGIKLCAMSD
jgi:hypothetical protein